ncbi:MAG: hypothetical protein RIT39_808, partial [Bacteroidota bacterium]
MGSGRLDTGASDDDPRGAEEPGTEGAEDIARAAAAGAGGAA